MLRQALVRVGHGGRRSGAHECDRRERHGRLRSRRRHHGRAGLRPCVARTRAPASTGYGVWGSQAGNGTGVYGSSYGGKGVFGETTVGNAVYGYTPNGESGVTGSSGGGFGVIGSRNDRAGIVGEGDPAESPSSVASVSRNRRDARCLRPASRGFDLLDGIGVLGNSAARGVVGSWATPPRRDLRGRRLRHDQRIWRPRTEHEYRRSPRRELGRIWRPRKKHRVLTESTALVQRGTASTATAGHRRRPRREHGRKRCPRPEHQRVSACTATAPTAPPATSTATSRHRHPVQGRRLVQDRPSARSGEQVPLALVRRVAGHDERLQRQRRTRRRGLRDGGAAGLLRGAQPRLPLPADGDRQAAARDRKEIANNHFTIRTDQPNVKVSWQVTGVRQDAYANAHRIPVDEAESRPTSAAPTCTRACTDSRARRRSARSSGARRGRRCGRRVRPPLRASCAPVSICLRRF